MTSAVVDAATPQRGGPRGRDRPAGGPGRPGRSPFRADIQGLRGAAVLLVVLYHAGVPLLPGGFVGVDVFFVISGFLITGLLLREADASGRISLTAFYARRARRILPAGVLVLVSTAVLAVLILPRTRWDDVGWHITTGALSAVNWVFAAESVDYLAADSAESPVQHFWTLAVEEQFYLVWPLLLALALARGGRRAAGVAILCLTLASFAWSVHYTATAPGPAYFVTTTRLWELGVGALLAVGAGAVLRMPRTLASALGWVGLAAVIAAATLYDANTPFPGAAAALPVLGAAAILASGARIGNAGVGALLALHPLTWLGDRSYALYLWHWPFLIFAGVLFDGTGALPVLAAVVGSLLAADLSLRFVERPLAARPLSTPPQRAVALSAGAVLVLGAVLAGQAIVVMPDPAARAAPEPARAAPAVPGDAPRPGGSTESGTGADAAGAGAGAGAGAAALSTDPTAGRPTDTVGTYSPAATEASGDNPSVYSDGCHVSQLETRAIGCVYGDPTGDFSVALVGDSHAAQWVPALQRIADDEGWRLSSYTKSRCAVSSAVLIAKDTVDTPYRECIAWNTELMEILTGPAKPDLVITSSMLQPVLVDGVPTDDLTPFASGLTDAVTRLTGASVPVVMLVDTPFVGINVPDCVVSNETTLTECAVERTVAIDRQGDAERAATAGLDAVPVLDLNDLICPASRCAPIIGGVLVYRDDNHLTASYAETLHAALRAELAATGLVPAAPGS